MFALDYDRITITPSALVHRRHERRSLSSDDDDPDRCSVQPECPETHEWLECESTCCSARPRIHSARTCCTDRARSTSCVASMCTRPERRTPNWSGHNTSALDLQAVLVVQSSRFVSCAAGHTPEKAWRTAREVLQSQSKASVFNVWTHIQIRV